MVKRTIEDYKELGSVREIPPNEKEAYISFLELTYKDNIKVSEFLLVKFPRWSIISGYYAMHDVSKLYLAKKYNLKITRPLVHSAVIQALRELVRREDIIKLIERAEEEYDSIFSLHLTLLQGKDEREKSQYYTTATVKPEVSIQKATYFLDKIAKQYLLLIEKMMKDDS